MAKKKKPGPGRMSPKHERNRQKKLDRLAREGKIRCSVCGRPSARCSCQGSKMLCESDNGFDVATKKWQQTRAKENRLWMRWASKPQTEPAKLSIPEFLGELHAKLSACSEIPADRLEYVGMKRFGAKSGNNSFVAHKFSVTSPKEVLEDGEIKFLWHGTPFKNIKSILMTGFRTSRGGLLGAGLYLGEKRKAMRYASKAGRGWGIMVRCKVSLGLCVPASEIRDLSRINGIDSIQAFGMVSWAWGGKIIEQEWCIKNPRERVSIHNFYLFKK